MLTDVIASLRALWTDIGAAIVDLAPRIVVALILLVVGWAVARATAWIVTRVLALVPVDRTAERLALGNALRLAELPPASRLIASSAVWLVWLTTIALVIETLRLPGFENARGDLFDFLGHLVKASLILVIGIFASHVVWKTTLLAAYNAGVGSARLMATALRVLVIAIATLTALAQIGVPMVIVLTAFSIAFGALMLGLALAFGLGGRDAARDVIARHHETPHAPDTSGQSHL